MTVHRRISRGFTLIEVLVTLLFISIALPAIMGGITAATKIAASSKRRDEASGLAQSQLAQLLASGTWQTGNSSGDFGNDWPDYHWQSNVAAWASDTSGEGIEQIDLKVTWNGVRGQEDSITLSSLAYPRVSSTATATATQ